MPPTTTAGSSSFDTAWRAAADVPGWCTRDQARALYDAVARLPGGGSVVEIGSHQGRSTVVLAHAARSAGARVTAVDPFVSGRMFGGAATRAKFERTITSAGVDDVVTLEADYSRAVRRRWSGPVDVLYVDGKHDYWSVVDDLRWGEHVVPGGEVLVHDAFSSVGVTLGLLRAVALGRGWTYVDRTGSLARLRRTPPTVGDRARVLAELPWFTRNVVVKVLLRLRLRPLTRLLGHDAPHDPY